MSALFRNLKPGQILHIHKVLNAAQCDGVRKSHWFPDHIPGPYPKTKEELENAAKKYNLLPAEYKPYPNDERSCGDYPELPMRSIDKKDPWYDWDWPHLRRNFNEPLHEKTIHLLSEGMTISPEGEDLKRGWGIVVAFIICTAVMYCIKFCQLELPVLEKQYPTPGVTHYTFELGGPLKKKKIRDPSCDEEDD